MVYGSYTSLVFDEIHPEDTVSIMLLEKRNDFHSSEDCFYEAETILTLINHC